MENSVSNLLDWYRAFRRRVREHVPLMKRKRHRRLLGYVQKELEREREITASVASLFLSLPSFAVEAKHVVNVPLRITACDELCLFVSHAPECQLKLHVIEHITALLDEGMSVVLIVNADVDPAAMQVPPSLAARLAGCLVRENIGFDFAAWAHAYAHLDVRQVRKRLYLINDSIVGPLNLNSHRALISRIRSATADMVGLTLNPDPFDHLQSYFLVFGRKILDADVFSEFMQGVVNMPSKQNVIDCYEVRLTGFLIEHGFSSAAIFPNIAEDPMRRNDTIHSWKKLIKLGFPFVKSAVLKDEENRHDVLALIPGRYL